MKHLLNVYNGIIINEYGHRAKFYNAYIFILIRLTLRYPVQKVRKMALASCSIVDQ